MSCPGLDHIQNSYEKINVQFQPNFETRLKNLFTIDYEGKEKEEKIQILKEEKTFDKKALG